MFSFDENYDDYCDFHDNDYETVECEDCYDEDEDEDPDCSYEASAEEDMMDNWGESYDTPMFEDYYGGE
jgi:hypothetical protein